MEGIQDPIVALTAKDIPALHGEQLNRFTSETIHVERVMSFDPEKSVQRLAKEEGRQAVAADFGGDKGTSLLFTVQQGKAVPSEGYEDRVQGDNGAGYVASLAKSAAYASEHNLPFGITWGGPIVGTKPTYHPKAPTFIDDLVRDYNGDLQALSPSVKAVLNDGPAGVISGAVEAYRQYGATNVLFIINGGGIGLGVLKDGVIYATESGHVEVIPELNPYHQATPCGLFDQTFTCLEHIGANKAGIEEIWQAQTGAYMRARDIEDEYKKGNTLAAELYDQSALIVAHVIQGAANAMGINLTDSKTAVVCHGGAFKFPHYGERVQQILESASTGKLQMLLTKDYCDPASNACLDGAAIAALVA